MGYKRTHSSDYETLCHSDYLSLSEKYPYLYKHLSNDKFRRFEYIDEDSTYHLSKATLLEFYGIHLKLPCSCPVVPLPAHLNLKTTREIIWNPKLISKCDIPINSNADDFSHKIAISNHYLTPCVPGRKLYLDTINSLLEQNLDYQNFNKNIRILDIGTGASAIYALLGSIEYGWNFVATDICDETLNIARHNIYINKLDSKIVLRKQNDSCNMFGGVIDRYEFFHFTICNPPFYGCYEDRRDNIHTHRMGSNNEIIFNMPDSAVVKLFQNYRNTEITTSNDDYVIYPAENDGSNNLTDTSLNSNKFHTSGEFAFVRLMILESRFYCNNVLWFTSLVSKKFNLKKLKQLINSEMAEYYCQDLCFSNAQNQYLDHRTGLIRGNYIRPDKGQVNHCKLNGFKVREIRVFEIKPGKISRWILCWTFYDADQRKLILKTNMYIRQ